MDKIFQRKNVPDAIKRITAVPTVRKDNTTQHNGGKIESKEIFFEGQNMYKIHKDNIPEKGKRNEKL